MGLDTLPPCTNSAAAPMPGLSHRARCALRPLRSLKRASCLMRKGGARGRRWNRTISPPPASRGGAALSRTVGVHSSSGVPKAFPLRIRRASPPPSLPAGLLSRLQRLAATRSSPLAVPFRLFVLRSERPVCMPHLNRLGREGLPFLVPPAGIEPACGT